MNIRIMSCTSWFLSYRIGTVTVTVVPVILIFLIQCMIFDEPEHPEWDSSDLRAGPQLQVERYEWQNHRAFWFRLAFLIIFEERLMRTLTILRDWTWKQDLHERRKRYVCLKHPSELQVWNRDEPTSSILVLTARSQMTRIWPNLFPMDSEHETGNVYQISSIASNY